MPRVLREGGRRKRRAGEGRERTSGQVEASPLKRSSGVSSVEARVAQGAQRPPGPPPLVLVSS